jgi:hypothetical protein
MGQLLPPPSPDYLDHIEPVAVAGHPRPLSPDFRHPGDGPLLPPPHGFATRTEPGPTTGLHFHEGHDRAAADNEIDLVATHPEALGEYLPPSGLQPLPGLALSLAAERLPGILGLTHTTIPR